MKGLEAILGSFNEKEFQKAVDSWHQLPSTDRSSLKQKYNIRQAELLWPEVRQEILNAAFTDLPKAFEIWENFCNQPANTGQLNEPAGRCWKFNAIGDAKYAYVSDLPIMTGDIAAPPRSLIYQSAAKDFIEADLAVGIRLNTEKIIGWLAKHGLTDRGERKAQEVFLADQPPSRVNRNKTR